MAGTEPEVDLTTVPLVALNVTVRKKLGLYLNPKHTVAADWMEVAEEMGFSYLEIENYKTLLDPTRTVLGEWAARNSDASVGKLLSILEKKERRDIVEDLRSLIGEVGARARWFVLAKYLASRRMEFNESCTKYLLLVKI